MRISRKVRDISGKTMKRIMETKQHIGRINDFLIYEIGIWLTDGDETLPIAYSRGIIKYLSGVR